MMDIGFVIYDSHPIAVSYGKHVWTWQGPVSPHVAPPYGSFIGRLIPVHVRPYYETAIEWRPHGPEPVLIGPGRIPWLCASNLTAQNVKTAYQKVAKTGGTTVSHMMFTCNVD